MGEDNEIFIQRGRTTMQRTGSVTRKVCTVTIVLFCAAVLCGGCAKRPVEMEKPAVEPVPRPSGTEVVVDARLRASNNDLEGAAAMLEELVGREAHDIEALRLLAGIYSTMGKQDASAAVWERIAMLDPADADAAYQVGTTLARAGDWQTLRSRMLATDAVGAADGRHYLLLGEADKELGYRDEAETYLKRAGELERARYLLGTLYYEQGKLQQARTAFENVIARNPGNYSALLHLGWIYYNGGAFDRALHHYRSAIKLKPDEPLARLSVAALHAEMKHPREAIDQYRTALSLRGIPRSERKKAFNSLSRLLVENGILSEAKPVIEEGLAEFPDSGGLYYQWGEALLKSGNTGEAREKFKTAAADPLWREIALRRLHSIK